MLSLYDIPYSVTDEIRKANPYFERIEVWRKHEIEKDPIAVGIAGGQRYMIARWGVDKLIPFETIKKSWDSLDIVVHAVAYAPREALAGGFVESTSREAFKVAHDVSSYSLTALARAAKPLMAGRAGAILTLSYLGAVKSIPSYNVMGLAKASLEANVRFLAADMGPDNIRVNGISAGPIKTLAAAGIAGFRKMLSRVADVAPLRRNVTLEDVGNAAAFLCSDLANGVTGEIMYVDAGFSTVGMSFPQEAGEG